MCRHLEEQMREATAKAKSILGQLGPLVWALHASHGCVIDEAEGIAKDPERNVCVGPGISEDVRARAVADIKALIAGIPADAAGDDLLSTRGMREVLNRSIVVYAVAVLEGFLEEAGKELYACRAGNKVIWPDSFGKRCEVLAKKVVRLYCCPHYGQAALLALYRHKIVHSDGRLDGKTPGQVACIDRESGSTLHFRLSDKSDSVVWHPTSGTGLCQQWVDGKLAISLAVDEVILPLVRAAQAFVAEAEGELLKHAKQPCSHHAPPP